MSWWYRPVPSFAGAVYVPVVVIVPSAAATFTSSVSVTALIGFPLASRTVADRRIGWPSGYLAKTRSSCPGVGGCQRGRCRGGCRERERGQRGRPEHGAGPGGPPGEHRDAGNPESAGPGSGGGLGDGDRPERRHGT